MANKDFVEYVCDQIRDVGMVRYRAMFGAYMVYVNDKPLLLVGDNLVFIKNLDCIRAKMLASNAELAKPYEEAREHFILDIDNAEFSREIVQQVEAVTPFPKPKKKKNATS